MFCAHNRACICVSVCYCVCVCIVGPVITMHDMESSAVTVALHSCGRSREREEERHSSDLHSRGSSRANQEEGESPAGIIENGESRESYLKSWFFSPHPSAEASSNSKVKMIFLSYQLGPSTLPDSLVWNCLFCPGHIVDMVECGHQGLWGTHTHTHSHKHKHFNCGVITHTTTGKWESGEQQLQVMESIPLLFGLVLSLSLSFCLHCTPVGFHGFKGGDNNSSMRHLDVSKVVK